MNAFGQLIRRVWSRGLFKPQISPQEMLQAISVESRKYFESKNYEPVEFLSWFLNHLHKDLGGTKRPGSSIVHACFQGLVQVSTHNTKKSSKQNDTEPEYQEVPEVTITPFLHLSLDVPPPPVFTSETERDIIPQVPLYELLSKFDGKTVQVCL